MLSKSSSEKVKRYCAKYKLHEEHGFYHHLLNDEPLPSEFKELEACASKKIIGLNAAKETRKAILELVDSVKGKKLSADGLTYLQTLKLYSLMTYLANSYIYCEEDLTGIDTLPAPISVLLYDTAKVLEIRPVFSYTSCTFWNAALVDSEGPVDLDNLKTRINFTDNPGEEWFLTIPIYNDILGYKILKQLVLAQEEVENDNPDGVAAQLRQVLTYLDLMIKAIKRMGEKLTPEFFSGELRRYLNGYQKFENGLKFEGVPEFETKGCNFPGATAGQSPFYQTFENAIGLVYDDVVIQSMQKDLLEGMARISKDMVYDAKKYFTIRDFAIKNQGKVKDAYNDILDLYMKYKQTHWSLIARFIVSPARSMGTESPEKKMAGTAGTPLHSLKNMGKMIEDNKI